MSAQPQLFDPGTALTEQQRRAYNLTHGRGATALDVGTALHAARSCRFCIPGRPCQYAESGGRAILGALRKKGLVTRRRESGRWQQTGKPVAGNPVAAADTSACDDEGEIPF